MFPRIITFAAALNIAIIGIAYAADPIVPTGSGADAGSGAQIIIDPWASDRELRAKDFYQRILKSTKSEQQYRTQRTVHLRKRADHRNACHEDMRRSNRDTRMRTLLQCYRGELTEEREFLRKQRDFISQLSFVSDPLRRQAMTRHDLLIDAINTVIFAIDSNVYESAEDVLEAKKNLFSLYRTKTWEILTVLRADRTLSWLAYLLSDIQKVADAELTGSGTIIVRDEWIVAKQCLIAEEETLRNITSLRSHSQAHEALKASFPALKTCIGRIQEGLKVAESGALIVP